MELELRGLRYILYLEGDLQCEPPVGLTLGRTCFSGFGRITDNAEATSELFPFKTPWVLNEPPVDQTLVLTPIRFGRIRGRNLTDVTEMLMQDPRIFVDALCASKLDWIENWKSIELIRKGQCEHRLLLPAPILFGPLPGEVINAVLTDSEVPASS